MATMMHSPSAYPRRRRPVSPVRRWLRILLRLGILITPLVLLVVGETVWLSSFIGDLTGGHLGNLPETRPDTLIVDSGHVMDAVALSQLNRRIEEVNARCQTDLQVVVLKDLPSQNVQESARALFERWKLGRGQYGHRGALLLVVNRPRSAALQMDSDLENYVSQTALVTSTHFSDSLIHYFRRVSDMERPMDLTLNAMLQLFEQQFSKRRTMTTEEVIF